MCPKKLKKWKKNWNFFFHETNYKYHTWIAPTFGVPQITLEGSRDQNLRPCKVGLRVKNKTFVVRERQKIMGFLEIMAMLKTPLPCSKTQRWAKGKLFLGHPIAFYYSLKCYNVPTKFIKYHSVVAEIFRIGEIKWWSCWCGFYPCVCCKYNGQD